MDEMTATFEPTPEVRELLEGKLTEYIVVNPVAVEAKFKDGRVVRYPQEIRERIVRCRDCTRCERVGDMAYCHHFRLYVPPRGFCWAGEPR